jgi:hypothetical protein
VTTTWFEVDKEGLAKLLERKGKEFILYELIQNAWDTNAKRVDVELIPNPNLRGYSILKVIDDHPEGWKNLAHAWTLFAESEKKGNAEKRGRFNLGEKLVLSLCKSARIETTTGGVRFDESGRHPIRHKRFAGSLFSAEVRITEEERRTMRAAIGKLIPPPDVETIFNGVKVLWRTPLRKIEATLPTEVADGEGVLRKSSRKTTVEVYPVLEGETAMVYEMGIPVVETGDKWHYNVMQKVPLNADRDNVTPAYLREIRTLVLNEMYREVAKDDATETWVRDASESEDISKEAITHVVTQRFGEKRVIFDPSDPEGTKLAASKEYSVIAPGSLSGAEWANVKRHEAALPAGQVTPSPRPYSPDGEKLDLIPLERYTEGMKRISQYAKEVALRLLACDIQVDMVSKATWPYSATYGPGHLTFNVGRLGRIWFEDGPRDTVDRLLIHEFGHHYSSDHLSEQYHDALCKLGARLVQLAIDEPSFFEKYGRGKGAL